MKIHSSWYNKLESEIQKPYIKELKEFLQKEKNLGKIIYPDENLVFHAFSQTPWEMVKVVIMGQDPYHGPGQAHGLSFSVPQNVTIPPSLRNIYQEIATDLQIKPPKTGCLIPWAKQGVLLLNATLTVQAGLPKSHYGRGWETFTDAVIDLLAQREDPLVFILWGASAREKCTRILSQREHPHLVLHAAHPSPFSATKFFGCRHFSQTNFYLKKWGRGSICWEIDE